MKNFVFIDFKFTEGRLVVFNLVGMVLGTSYIFDVSWEWSSQTCCIHIQGNN